jgi:hypothetical protein
MTRCTRHRFGLSAPAMQALIGSVRGGVSLEAADRRDSGP